MKRHQITIVDIAQKLNLSKSTVSRVLTGHPSVSEKRVKQYWNWPSSWIINATCFPLACSTKKQYHWDHCARVYQFLFPTGDHGGTRGSRPRRLQYHYWSFNENYETEVANTKQMLASQVDGLLVSITKETRNFDHLKVFERKGIPIVFFNRVCEDMNVPKVVVDDYEGAFRAVEHLIKRKKKRIAHLAGPDTLAISVKRLRGYRDALKKYNIPIDEELIIPYDLTIAKVKIYVNHLLRLDNPPDAIFAINDPTAIEALQIVKKKGLQVPRDIAIVGFSNDNISGLIEPALTTVSQPVKEIGSTAAQLLIDQISRDISEWKSIIRVLKTELIVRKSS
ncbi:LacI family DNA-binding transcriptional regulator [Paraflavitalea speifideaquila]|uniref:LacI family DNA-binding transcriptional regulator n=1 Tax=Paraflavitalea speifideaquila TaxID=3076558 RepID=UPI0028F016A2|nr:LacI family DNA-binding transcriptional regulator [Paraflavitalea speifideiaquila]